MFIKVFRFHRKRIFLVAWGVPNVEGNEAVMQFIIAKRQKTYDRWLPVGGLGHDPNTLARRELARTAESDGRGKKILNVCVAAIDDLPNLTSTRNWCGLGHGTQL